MCLLGSKGSCPILPEIFAEQRRGEPSILIHPPHTPTSLGFRDVMCEPLMMNDNKARISFLALPYVVFIFNKKYQCSLFLLQPSPNFDQKGRSYVSGRCPMGVQDVSGRYQDCVWFLESVCKVSGRHKEGLRKVSGRCLESAWKVSGIRTLT